MCSGGVCGMFTGESFAIINCYNSGKVNGNGNAYYTGGVCGNVSGGIAVNCYNVGTVSTENIYNGGIFGFISDYYPYYYSNCYYLKEGRTFNNDYGTSMTKEQFGNGEVCYLLSQGSTVADGKKTYYSGDVWGQEIGKDEYPVLGSYKVIRAARNGAASTDYWGTFSCQTSDADLGDLAVYKAQVRDGLMTLAKCDNTVAKGEGVLVKGNTEYLNALLLNTATEEAEADNDLVATPAEPQVIAETGYKYYRLTYDNSVTKEGLGFYFAVVKDGDGNVTSNDGSQIAATPGKAYLKVAESNTANARGFAFPVDGGTTGIECITISDVPSCSMADSDDIYDLMGRKVSNATKGLYIKNGKKVIIK